jgi:hypothetical protein
MKSQDTQDRRRCVESKAKVRDEMKSKAHRKEIANKTQVRKRDEEES